MPHRTTAFEIVWQNPWVRALVYLASTAFVIWLLVHYNGYVFALQVGIISFAVAYILNPLVNLLKRLKMGRAFAVFIVYFLLILLLIFGSVLITRVIAELGRFIDLVPTAFDSISNTAGGISENVSSFLTRLSQNLPTFLSERFGVQTSNDELSVAIQSRLESILITSVDNISDALQQLAVRGPSLLVSSATSIISTTLQIVLILLASAYFLFDFEKFVASFRSTVPVRWRYLFDDLTQKADVAVGGYLRGQLLITLFIATFIYIGLAILGIPSALAISFLAALFNLVPYLGPIIGVIPAVLLGFTVSPWTALGAVIVFIVANQLEGNVLAPYILSKSTNLHPVTVLLAILAGAGMFGLLGALLAVPAVALGKVVIEEYIFMRPAYQEHLLQADVADTEGLNDSSESLENDKKLTDKRSTDKPALANSDPSES